MDATCTIQDSIHVFSLVHKYVSRILGTYQNTTDISFVRIYRTENMTTDKSKMVVASIMQTLFKESFLEIIFALLQSTYSPYHKRF